MELKRVLKEVCLYTVGAVLSCGPSQIFGIVKGFGDIKKYLALKQKIRQWQHIQTLCHQEKYSKLKETRAFKQLVKEGSGDTQAVLYQRILSKAKDRLFDLQQKVAIRKTYCLKDCVSLIPLVGAIFACRIGAEKSATGVSMASMVEQAAAHVSNNLRKLVNSIVYPLSRIHNEHISSDEDHVRIPVESRGGYLDAMFFQGLNASQNGPTVVIFHGNFCTCNEMLLHTEWYVMKGFNVLIPTMGGYPGSPGVTTSEASCYQDIEAIKKYLDSRGIKKAGYHGISIGGTLAFQAAAGKSEAQVRTLFVVADQTLGSMKSIAVRRLPFLPSVAKGAIQSAFPVRKVRLSDTLQVETDGLDNVRKARLIRESNIPLIVIKSTLDNVMGSHLKNGRYEKNCADDLIEERYEKEMERRKYLIEIEGEHATNFRNSNEAMFRLKNFIDQIKA